MSNDIENKIRDSLEEKVPRGLDRAIYSKTNSFKKKREKSILIFKSVMGFSFVFTLIVYNFMYTPSLDLLGDFDQETISFIQDVDLDLAVELEKLSEEEIEYLLSDDLDEMEASFEG